LRSGFTEINSAALELIPLAVTPARNKGSDRARRVGSTRRGRGSPATTSRWGHRYAK
jgi:hypothetical protein